MSEEIRIDITFHDYAEEDNWLEGDEFSDFTFNFRDMQRLTDINPEDLNVIVIERIETNPDGVIKLTLKELKEHKTYLESTAVPGWELLQF